MKNIGCIEASVIASKDGLLISSNMTEKCNSEVAVLMFATILEAAERATIELRKGTPYRVIVESNKGRIILTEAGAKALLVVKTKPEADLRLVENEMVNASKK